MWLKHLDFIGFFGSVFVLNLNAIQLECTVTYQKNLEIGECTSTGTFAFNNLEATF